MQYTLVKRYRQVKKEDLASENFEFLLICKKKLIKIKQMIKLFFSFNTKIIKD